ncbi:MAG: hypothetical protein US26_C0011G0008 [Candidatus Nomurabacteria bacterium GW2011_GWE1_36_71]|nr:MAG: hypothetical protein US26_C0011G0008 [Candidatus Nomurabacteria bacterium GW2011_GWE1_36_71]
MIDTIVLTLPHTQFTILEHKNFNPNTFNLFEPPYLSFGNKPYIKCVFNPTKKELTGYHPRLTIIKVVRRSAYPIFLRIGFSIPKLLYGNNFDEVSDSDFWDICKLLKNKLFDMGVSIRDIKYLEEAPVSTIHYSKNIVLTDYTEPFHYINEMKKVDISMMYDINQTDYRNHGLNLKFRSNQYEFAMYDKLQDLKQANSSEKKGEEDDYEDQLNLFEKYPQSFPFEVLRLEVRLGDKKKIKRELTKIDESIMEPTFRSLFKSIYSQKLILNILHSMKDNYPKLLNTREEDIQSIVKNILMKNPHIKLNTLLAVVGYKYLVQDSGIRGFRNMIRKFSDNSWYNLKRNMGNISIDTGEFLMDRIISDVEKFETVHIDK